MRSHPDRETLFQEAMARIATVSPREGADILLHYFLGVVNGLDAGAASRLREEIASRFGGRFCSQEMCTLMLELLNGHLGRAPLRPAA